MSALIRLCFRPPVAVGSVVALMLTLAAVAGGFATGRGSIEVIESLPTCKRTSATSTVRGSCTRRGRTRRSANNLGTRRACRLAPTYDRNGWTRGGASSSKRICRCTRSADGSAFRATAAASGPSSKPPARRWTPTDSSTGTLEPNPHDRSRGLEPPIPELNPTSAHQFDQ